MTESVESVLAEMRRGGGTETGWIGIDTARDWADRLAAAHAREVGMLRNEAAVTGRRVAGAMAALHKADELRIEAVDGLLREVRGEVDRIAGGYHQSDEAHDMMLALHELRDRLDAHLSGAKHD